MLPRTLRTAHTCTPGHLTGWRYPSWRRPAPPVPQGDHDPGPRHSAHRAPHLLAAGRAGAAAGGVLRQPAGTRGRARGGGGRCARSHRCYCREGAQRCTPCSSRMQGLLWAGLDSGPMPDATASCVEHSVVEAIARRLAPTCCTPMAFAASQVPWLVIFGALTLAPQTAVCYYMIIAQWVSRGEWLLHASVYTSMTRE